MFLAFAFLDIGRAVFEYNTLTNAARSAARVAVVNQIDPAAGPWNCQANKPVESVVSPELDVPGLRHHGRRGARGDRRRRHGQLRAAARRDPRVHAHA